MQTRIPIYIYIGIEGYHAVYVIELSISDAIDDGKIKYLKLIYKEFDS